MIYLSLLLLAILPSLIWMLYYLQKDKEPEPKRYIVYVFVFGALFAILTYFLQTGSLPLLERAGDLFSEEVFAYLVIFLLVAFSEELAKYLAVFFTMMRNAELDEPVDLIIYMITAALGFAALENLIHLYSLGPPFIAEEMVKLTALRFAGATFLHALVSGILGIFLVYVHRFRSRLILFAGFLFATTFHGIYNMLIVKAEETLFFILLILLLLFLAILLSLGIGVIKRMRSICFFR